MVVLISCLITAGPLDPFAGLWRSSPGRGRRPYVFVGCTMEKKHIKSKEIPLLLNLLSEYILIISSLPTPKMH